MALQWSKSKAKDVEESHRHWRRQDDGALISQPVYLSVDHDCELLKSKEKKRKKKKKKINNFAKRKMLSNLLKCAKFKLLRRKTVQKR